MTLGFIYRYSSFHEFHKLHQKIVFTTNFSYLCCVYYNGMLFIFFCVLYIIIFVYQFLLRNNNSKQTIKI